MEASHNFRLAAFGIALLNAGAALADEPVPASDPAQQRGAYREQMQERMRNTAPEGQKLMRETRSNDRERMENRQAVQGDVMRRGGSDGGYGQGYEARQGGGGSSSGGGRGMGGGRNR